MRGNYKVRVRVPIYATVEVVHTVYDAENEGAAIAQALEATDEVDVGFWFEHDWKPSSRPLPGLAEVIEFEATETDQPKEGMNEDH